MTKFHPKEDQRKLTSMQQKISISSADPRKAVASQLVLTTFVTVAASNDAIKICQIEERHGAEQSHRKHLQTYASVAKNAFLKSPTQWDFGVLLFFGEGGFWFFQVSVNRPYLISFENSTGFQLADSYKFLFVLHSMCQNLQIFRFKCFEILATQQ